MSRLTVSLTAILLLASAPVFAQGTTTGFAAHTPAQKYVAIRKAYPPMASVTLNDLSLDPKKFRGRTLELEGSVSGTMRTGKEGEELIYLILQTENSGSVSLVMSFLPEWVQSKQRIRVLVLVTGGDPNTIEMGIPTMEVVALANAADIALIDRPKPAPTPAKPKRGSGLASRGGASARLTPGSMPPNLSASAQSVFIPYRDYIRTRNRRLSDEQVNTITAAVLNFSERLELDPRLMIAVIIAESDFDIYSRSGSGAMGLGQLMPGTAAEVGVANPWDPVQSVAGCAIYLKTQLNRYSGGLSAEQLEDRHIQLALAAYNAGPGNVKKYGGIPPFAETQKYVRKIMTMYRQLRGEAG